jgi:LAS superfamily LD-carboxypeptidase LdcB
MRKNVMTAKFDPNDWNSALVQLKSEHATPSNPAPTDAQSVREREAFKVKVIESRVKLKLMRDRTDALKEALERFRSRQHAMRA